MDNEEKQTAQDYINLIKREAALKVLMEASNILCSDASLTAGERNSLHKVLSKAYSKFKTEERL